MSQDYTKASFKKLLEKLQEESWQLELIISGFAIFGLISVFPVIQESVQESQNGPQIYKFVISLVAQISCAILIFNLLLHVLLRGLWIGALGLRYVSGDIDYEVLNYSEKFTHYLKKKVGSFDKYIATLENYCSIIFAITFLLIFYVLALTFTILAIAFTANYLLDNDAIPGWLSKGVGIPLILFILIGMLLTFIDFITLGFLKKKKWISKIYFPVYWAFSFITLSFLYRPLVYNFLDNKFGRRLSLILVPFYFLILLSSSLQYKDSNYFNPNMPSSDILVNNDNYEDLLTDSNEFKRELTIQSKVIKDPFVKVFIRHSKGIEDRIFDFNSSLKPEKDKRGLSTGMTFSNEFDSSINKDSLQREYLKTFNQIYSITIDSSAYDIGFVLSQNKKNKLGFETYVNIDGIEKGKHVLKLNRLRIRKNDTTKLIVRTIPFWYFND